MPPAIRRVTICRWLAKTVAGGMSLNRSLMPARTKQISGRAATTQVSSIHSICPVRYPPCPAFRTSRRPSRGFQSLPFAVSESPSRTIRTFAGDWARMRRITSLARFDRDGGREGLSGREHPAEEIPDVGREPGESGLVEHQSVGGVPGRQIRAVSQTRRRVETGVIPACGEGFQRFVEPGDAAVQIGVFSGCRKRQQDNRSGSRRIEPFADRPESL